MIRELLSLPVLAGCVRPVSEERSFDCLPGHVESIMLEAEAMAQRHTLRESLRARGLWVCEEGEWPQRWQEFCNTCWCAPDSVRICTRLRCKWDERPPKTGPMCENPEFEPPPFEPPNQSRGPAAMGEMRECFDYFDDPGIGDVVDRMPP